MKPVAKVEIIIDSMEVKNVMKLLDEVGVSGYSIINNVVGKGSRGVMTGDVFTDLFESSYVLVVCEEKEMHRIVEAIRPIINKFGGICIVSDVVLRIHRK